MYASSYHELWTDLICLVEVLTLQAGTIILIYGKLWLLGILCRYVDNAEIHDKYFYKTLLSITVL